MDNKSFHLELLFCITSSGHGLLENIILKFKNEYFTCKDGGEYLCIFMKTYDRML